MGQRTATALSVVQLQEQTAQVFASTRPAEKTNSSPHKPTPHAIIAQAAIITN
jgi:hypothetical protein